MDGKQISVMVLILGTDNLYEQTLTHIEAACDLNDLEFTVFDLAQDIIGLETNFYGSMKQDKIYIADFTNVIADETQISKNLLMLAYTAVWAYEKPLIALINKEVSKNLPFGWEKYDHIVEYTTEDAKALKKPLAKKILEFSEIIESGESIFAQKKNEFIKDEQEEEIETASQRKHRLGVDESLAKKADAEASKQQELNRMLKQRFREKMLTDMKKSPEELAKEAAAKAESKIPGMLRAPEGADNKPRVPEGMRNIAEEMKSEEFKSHETDELKQAIEQAKPKEKSRLMELQEKYQQKVKQLELEDHNLDLNLDDSDSSISQKLKDSPVGIRKGVGYLKDVKTGNKVQLIKSELTIGRHPECDICIADAKVSKHHAVILRGVDKAYYIQDLESKHGTQLQSKTLQDMMRLSDGDEIKIAATGENANGVRTYVFTQQVS